jgi:hypothetical protein
VTQALSVPLTNFSLMPFMLYESFLNAPDTGGSYLPGPGSVLILKGVAVIPAELSSALMPGLHLVVNRGPSTPFEAIE